MDSIGWSELLLLIVSFGTFLAVPGLLITVVVLLLRKKDDDKEQRPLN